MASFVAAKFVELWKAVHVELQGKYSTNRVQALFTYHNKASSFRVFFVLLLTPLPCFALITVVDLVPLRPITEGIESSQLFFLRAFLCFWVVSVTVYGQFKHMVPPSPLSNLKIVIIGAGVAGIAVSVMYVMTYLIGYPLPFGIVTVSPVWVPMLLVPFVSWMNKARGSPEVWTLLVSFIKITACQESLVFIYPAYFYLFTIVPENGKTPFSLLLPVMKLLLRGVIGKMGVKDEIPQVVVMNVDVFSSLFTTYCLQSTPSIQTTCILMLADLLQTSVSLYDIELVVRRMRALKNASASLQSVEVQEKPNASPTDSLILKSTDRKRSNVTASASTPFAQLQASTRKLPQTIQPLNKIAIGTEGSKGILSKIAPLLTQFAHHDTSEQTNEDALGPSSKVIQFRYVRELRTVLYIAEFLVLINYVEVIIPVIFSAYLFAMYHLPNRAYYEHVSGMNDTHLHEALASVLLYAGLQLASLIILNLVLLHRLKISVLRQLVFVLEAQWDQVQNRLILWVFYNVQASLQQFGSDYTFKFTWLGASSSS